MSKSSKDNKKDVILSDNSDNESEVSDQSDEQSEESDNQSIITNKTITEKDNDKNKDKEKEKEKEKNKDNDIKKITPSKRKSKKEHVESLNDKIELIIDKEKLLKEEIINLKKNLSFKEKEREKYSDDKDKLIELLKIKSKSKKIKSEDTTENKKPNTGFAKPIAVPKVLQSFLKLEDSDKELSMTEITSLLSNKLIENNCKEEKYYIFNEKLLKEFKLTNDLIKANISEKALQNIKFTDNSLKIPYIYLKSLLKLLYT